MPIHHLHKMFIILQHGHKTYIIEILSQTKLIYSVNIWNKYFIVCNSIVLTV